VKIVGVVILATMLASLTDWLFFDLLVHRFYQATPAVWRPGGRRRIVMSQLISTIATAAAVQTAILIPGAPVLLATCLWAAGALPITIHNWQWMRVDPAIAASHALGWLTRLLIATHLTAKLL
jgi:hypothetical protein